MELETAERVLVSAMPARRKPRCPLLLSPESRVAITKGFPLGAICCASGQDFWRNTLMRSWPADAKERRHSFALSLLATLAMLAG